MLTQILENINDGVITARRDGTVSYINPYGEMLLGVTSADILGKKLSDFVIIKDEITGNNVEIPFEKIMQSNVPLYNQNHSILMNGDKESAHISYDITPLSLESKKSSDSSLLLVIRNVTETKKHKDGIEKKLREINSELEQFIYIASHDLQEPLRMVTSYVQLLDKRYKGKLDNDADEFIQFTVGGVKKMKNILNDLLSFSRLNTRKEELVEVNINELAEGIAGNFMAKPDMKIKFEIGDLPVINCYAGQIINLFCHLIDNAVKFSAPDKRVVKITSIQKDGFWQFSVEDQGIGIDKKYSDKVFSIFQKLHNGKDYTGTGVGLALCKKIVEIHGGSIWFDSVPGNGSVFHFTISAKDGVV